MNLAASQLFRPLLIHPFFLLVIGLISGIFIQYWLILPIQVAYMVSLITLLVGFFIRFPALSWYAFIASASFGFSIGSYRIHKQYTQQQFKIDQICNKKIDCIGKVVDLQISHDRSTKSRITLNITQFKDSSEGYWCACDANIFIYCKKQPIDLQIGDTITLQSITARHTENNTSFNHYLLKEDVVATIFLHNATYKKLQESNTNITNWLYAQRDTLVNRLRNKFSNSSLALFTSLFLGNRSEEKEEQGRIAQQSKNWGTSHHLARSGLHLVIFIYLLAMLLRLLPISLFAKECLLLILCIIYHIFSWSSVSFLRAFITFLCYKLCTLLGLPSHILHILTIACAIILIFNPIQLFFLDFQLSFGLTFILAWFNAAYQGKTA